MAKGASSYPCPSGASINPLLREERKMRLLHARSEVSTSSDEMRRSSSYHGCVCVEHDFVEIQNGLLFSRFDTLALYFTSTLVRALARSHEHFRVTDTLALHLTLTFESVRRSCSLRYRVTRGPVYELFGPRRHRTLLNRQLQVLSSSV